MWILYAKAVTYHEPTVMWLFMIGHSLGRMETCFGPATQVAGIRYKTHLKSRFDIKHISNPDFACCLLRHFDFDQI